MSNSQFFAQRLIENSKKKKESPREMLKELNQDLVIIEEAPAPEVTKKQSKKVAIDTQKRSPRGSPRVSPRNRSKSPAGNDNSPFKSEAKSPSPMGRTNKLAKREGGHAGEREAPQTPAQIMAQQNQQAIKSHKAKAKNLQNALTRLTGHDPDRKVAIREDDPFSAIFLGASAAKSKSRGCTRKHHSTAQTPFEDTPQRSGRNPRGAFDEPFEGVHEGSGGSECSSERDEVIECWKNEQYWSLPANVRNAIDVAKVKKKHSDFYYRLKILNDKIHVFTSIFYNRVPTYQVKWYEKKRKDLEEKLQRQKEQLEEEMKVMEKKITKKAQSQRDVIQFQFGKTKKPTEFGPLLEAEMPKSRLVRKAKKGGKRPVGRLNSTGVMELTVKKFGSLGPTNGVRESIESQNSASLSSGTPTSPKMHKHETCSKDETNIWGQPGQSPRRSTLDEPAQRAAAAKERAEGACALHDPLKAVHEVVKLEQQIHMQAAAKRGATEIVAIEEIKELEEVEEGQSATDSVSPSDTKDHRPQSPSPSPDSQPHSQASSDSAKEAASDAAMNPNNASKTRNSQDGQKHPEDDSESQNQYAHENIQVHQVKSNGTEPIDETQVLSPALPKGEKEKAPVDASLDDQQPAEIGQLSEEQQQTARSAKEAIADIQMGVAELIDIRRSISKKTEEVIERLGAEDFVGCTTRNAHRSVSPPAVPDRPSSKKNGKKSNLTKKQNQDISEAVGAEDPCTAVDQAVNRQQPDEDADSLKISSQCKDSNEAKEQGLRKQIEPHEQQYQLQQEAPKTKNEDGITASQKDIQEDFAEKFKFRNDEPLVLSDQNINLDSNPATRRRDAAPDIFDASALMDQHAKDVKLKEQIAEKRQQQLTERGRTSRTGEYRIQNFDIDTEAAGAFQLNNTDVEYSQGQRRESCSSKPDVVSFELIHKSKAAKTQVLSTVTSYDIQKGGAIGGNALIAGAMTAQSSSPRDQKLIDYFQQPSLKFKHKKSRGGHDQVPSLSALRASQHGKHPASLYDIESQLKEIQSAHAKNIINRRKNGKNYNHRVVMFSTIGPYLEGNQTRASNHRERLRMTQPNMTTYDYLKETRDKYGRNRTALNSFSVPSSVANHYKRSQQQYMEEQLKTPSLFSTFNANMNYQADLLMRKFNKINQSKNRATFSSLCSYTGAGAANLPSQIQTKANLNNREMRTPIQEPADLINEELDLRRKMMHSRRKKRSKKWMSDARSQNLQEQATVPRSIDQQQGTFSQSSDGKEMHFQSTKDNETLDEQLVVEDTNENPNRFSQVEELDYALPSLKGVKKLETATDAEGNEPPLQPEIVQPISTPKRPSLLDEEVNHRLTQQFLMLDRPSTEQVLRLKALRSPNLSRPYNEKLKIFQDDSEHITINDQQHSTPQYSLNAVATPTPTRQADSKYTVQRILSSPSNPTRYLPKYCFENVEHGLDAQFSAGNELKKRPLRTRKQSPQAYFQNPQVIQARTRAFSNKLQKFDQYTQKQKLGAIYRQQIQESKIKRPLDDKRIFTTPPNLDLEFSMQARDQVEYMMREDLLNASIDSGERARRESNIRKITRESMDSNRKLPKLAAKRFI